MDWVRFVFVTAAIAIVLWFSIGWALRAMGWARKGSPGAAFIGWALLMFGAGMNPQPPPQEQVEEANRERKLKKDAQSGDPERDAG